MTAPSPVGGLLSPIITFVLNTLKLKQSGSFFHSDMSGENGVVTTNSLNSCRSPKMRQIDGRGNRDN